MNKQKGNYYLKLLPENNLWQEIFSKRIYFYKCIFCKSKIDFFIKKKLKENNATISYKEISIVFSSTKWYFDHQIFCLTKYKTKSFHIPQDLLATKFNLLKDILFIFIIFIYFFFKKKKLPKNKTSNVNSLNLCC